MDENMENQTPENQPQDQPQQTSPPEYGESAPPIPEQSAAQAETPPPATGGELSKDEKMWGMFCHLAALAMFTSIPFANVLGPLILWLIKKDDFAFVNDQGKESLNFQISVSIYALVSSVTLCLPPLFFVLVFGIMITNLVFIIIAAIKTNEGQAYRYPCCIRLVK